MQAGIKIKLNVLLPVILLSVYSSVFSKTFQTVANGNWSDSLVWFANEVPPYSTSDSIHIKDSILFDQDIFITGNSLLLVDSGGGLCGHHTINVYTGTSFCNAGIVEVDSLMIYGGYFLNFGFGNLLFKKLMRVTNGGSAAFVDSSHGCGCNWEDCFVEGSNDGETTQPADSVTVRECTARAYPTPGDGTLRLEYNLFNNGWFTLYNTAGQLIDKKELKTLSGTESIHGENFSNGVYLWEVRIGSQVCGRGKIIVTH
jgi:hypothetical protein